MSPIADPENCNFAAPSRPFSQGHVLNRAVPTAGRLYAARIDRRRSDADRAAEPLRRFRSGENQSTAAKRGAPADARCIEHMPEAQRNAVFYRAIRDAGHECQQVGSSARSGESDGAPIWQARCRGGASWSIAITENGYALVVPAGPEPESGYAASANTSEQC
jgi:hypothetical protein